MNFKNFVQENFRVLHDILDSIKVGIWITDDEGKVILVNKESEKTGGLIEEDLLGKSMKELLKSGYILYESSILSAIKSGKEESIVQELGDGGHIFATSTPVGDIAGESLIVCTERNITETINLRELLKKSENLTKLYESELEHLHNQEIKDDRSIVAESFVMNNVVEAAKRAAKLDTTVMLMGESGTGKELIANIIYKNSNRCKGPFIKVNCAAIPENLMESEFFGYEKGAFTGASETGKIGFFEMANKGTLMLDEIGDLPIAMQPKLLRAIQEKEIRRIGGKDLIPVDVRLITATNVDLRYAIKEGKFREDLYYRLNVISIQIPPLRERKEDIPGLAKYFLKQFNKEYGMGKDLSKGAFTPLTEYDWPGNVRELKNIIERAMVNNPTSEIGYFQITKQLNQNLSRRSKIDRITKECTSLKELMEEYEKEVIMGCLEEGKTLTEVAKELKIDKSTVSRKFRKYHIETT